jgi:hypothetical protein
MQLAKFVLTTNIDNNSIQKENIVFFYIFKGYKLLFSLFTFFLSLKIVGIKAKMPISIPIKRVEKRISDNDISASQKKSFI